jgi:hypothetical protein
MLSGAPLVLLLIAILLCSVGPAALFCANLRLYRKPEPAGALNLPTMSVLIPARNEEAGIEAAINSVLQSTGIEFEVVVMDDSSTDRTAEIVAAVAQRDARVRLEQASPLPPGWNGKQHACWLLAHASTGKTLCFMDADVRLAPEAMSRMSAFMLREKGALVSGFPRQITYTWMEWLLLPLVHFILLGFLPLARMRSSTDPSLAAGCGQFMMVDRAAYLAAGGHSGIRNTMHDGLLLPRLLRSAGYRTDLADLTTLATCRMYTNARQVWCGLAKNATEGLAAPARIVPISLLLLLGQVAPVVLAFILWRAGEASAILWLGVAIAVFAAWLPRILAIRRFRQDWRGALLHPVGILVLLAVQWYALAGRWTGRAVRWKERSYATP